MLALQLWKKRDLMKMLRAIASAADVELLFVREGGNHEIWTIGGETIVIPRHREVNQRTAEAIITKVEEVTTDDG